MIRVRREVTRPYSAATKNAFSDDQPGEGQQLERECHGSRLTEGARVLGGRSSSKRISCQPSIAGAARPMRTYVLSSGNGRGVPRGAVPRRAEPREGHAVRLVAQPLHGLRAPLHLLLRPRVRAARRPALRRSLRRARSASRSTSRRCSGRSSHRPLVDAARRRDRRRDRPVPAGRGPLPAHARVHRGARRGREPVLDHHARPADRARRRRACRGGAARGRLGDVLGADARRGRLAARPSPARRRRCSGCGRCACSWTAGIRASVGMAPILPGHLGLARAARGGRRAPRARPAPAGSGRTCSTSSPARASTSSTAWPATGRELLPRYERLYSRTARTCRSRDAEPVRKLVCELARRARIRDRRPSPLRAASRARSSSASRSGIRQPDRLRTMPQEITDPDRRRPRGRPRGAAALALARAAHPRGRRGRRRRASASSSPCAASRTS